MATVGIHLDDELYSYVNKEGSRLHMSMGEVFIYAMKVYKKAREIQLRRTLNGE